MCGLCVGGYTVILFFSDAAVFAKTRRFLQRNTNISLGDNYPQYPVRPANGANGGGKRDNEEFNQVLKKRSPKKTSRKNVNQILRRQILSRIMRDSAGNFSTYATFYTHTKISAQFLIVQFFCIYIMRCKLMNFLFLGNQWKMAECSCYGSWGKFEPCGTTSCENSTHFWALTTINKIQKKINISPCLGMSMNVKGGSWGQSFGPAAKWPVGWRSADPFLVEKVNFASRGGCREFFCLVYRLRIRRSRHAENE